VVTAPWSSPQQVADLLAVLGATVEHERQVRDDAQLQAQRQAAAQQPARAVERRHRGGALLLAA
jgi:hypothetical protein